MMYFMYTYKSNNNNNQNIVRRHWWSCDSGCHKTSGTAGYHCDWGMRTMRPRASNVRRAPIQKTRIWSFYEVSLKLHMKFLWSFENEDMKFWKRRYAVFKRWYEVLITNIKRRYKRGYEVYMKFSKRRNEDKDLRNEDKDKDLRDEKLYLRFLILVLSKLRL